MIKAVIIEDEFNAANTLKKLLQYTQKDVAIQAVIDNVPQAITFLKSNTVDLVFMDIELVSGNAFDILKALSDISFKIIFTTAYDDFAIQAIKFDTVDYLLKPIDVEDLTHCMQRFRVSFKKQQQYHQALQALSEVDKNKSSDTLLIKTTQQQYMVALSDIIRCQSDGSYTIFYTKEKTIMSARNLKYYEQILDSSSFIRVHQSHLVNKAYIRVVQTNALVLLDGDKIPISSRKKNQLKAFLATI